MLYLPVRDGGESRDRISLHEGSRAVAFWKGRLIPYASIRQMLSCLQWPVDRDAKNEQHEMQARTVMLLFFGATSQVDGTKFHLQDDLQKALIDECAASRSRPFAPGLPRARAGARDCRRPPCAVAF